MRLLDAGIDYFDEIIGVSLKSIINFITFAWIGTCLRQLDQNFLISISRYKAGEPLIHDSFDEIA
jgi:hypothetical protein